MNYQISVYHPKVHRMKEGYNCLLSNQKVNPRTKQILKEGRSSSKTTSYKGLQVFHTHLGGPCHTGPVVISPLGHWDGTEAPRRANTCQIADAYLSVTILIPWPHPSNKWEKNSLQFMSTAHLCPSCSVSNYNNFVRKMSKLKGSDKLVSIPNGQARRRTVSLLQKMSNGA